MSPDSYASYRAAMPSECFGEPDDDDRYAAKGPAGPPDWYAVEWFAPVEFREVDSGAISTITAPCGRFFPADAHHDAYKAARRWAQAMADRKGVAWLREGWDRFPDLTSETRFTRQTEGSPW